MKSTIKIILSAFSLFAILYCADSARAERLFVVDYTTGAITEYGTEDFEVKQKLQIPASLRLLKRKSRLISKRLRISESGRILYFVDDVRLDRGTVVRRLWYWNGKKEVVAEVTVELGCFPGDDRCFVRDALSGPILDAEENAFYRGINRVVGFRQKPSKDDPSYFEYYVILEFEIYRVRFDDAAPGELIEERIAVVSFKECRCGTGVCEETCPQGIFVTPKEGVGDFMEIEHFVQGQLGSSVEGHTYLEKRGNDWVEVGGGKKREKPFLRTVYDGGCCGWDNESSDKLLLIDGKERKIIYDERERFGNRNYDISFYPSHAELSPDSSMVAYTIVTSSWAMANYRKTGALKLGSRGKENLKELERIKAVLGDLPILEVVSLDKETDRIVAIKRAEFIGWMDNHRLLVLKGGKLAAFDLSSRRLIESPVSVKSVEQVFLR